jgi:hypothetical protein
VNQVEGGRSRPPSRPRPPSRAAGWKADVPVRRSDGSRKPVGRRSEREQSERNPKRGGAHGSTVRGSQNASKASVTPNHQQLPTLDLVSIPNGLGLRQDLRGSLDIRRRARSTRVLNCVPALEAPTGIAQGSPWLESDNNPPAAA